MIERFKTLVFVGVICFVFQQACSYSPTAPTNAAKAHASAPIIKTDFAEGAKLSATELGQVVFLAKQCGISDVEYVSSFQRIPAEEFGIRVTSKRRIKGRNSSYDYVTMHRDGWGGSIEDAKVKRVGAFWVREPYLGTTLEREFLISNKNVRVDVGEGVDISFVDRVIPLIAARKVRLSADADREEFEHMDVSEPYSISRDDAGSGYQIHLPGQSILYFKEEKGQIVVTGVVHYII